MTHEHPIGEDELLAQRSFLRRLARGLVGDAELAEDVVQEAELRALAHGSEKADPRAWLVTVTRRIALNLRRAASRRTAHEDEARARTSTRGEPEPPEVLAGLELQHEVLAAVRALEEPYRAVVWLRYYEGLKPQAIAARLGVPVATVKTRLRRALERLRGELDDRNGGRREAWAVALAPLASRAAAVAGVTAGGLLVKKLVVAAALAALAFVGWRSWRGAEPARSAEPEAAQPVAELVEAPAPSTDTRAEPPVASARRDEVAEAPAVGQSQPVRAKLAVHVVHARDGGGAAAIGLVLWPEADPLAELHARFAETDAEGRARFEEVEPGAFTLHSDRATRVELELAAGEVRELAVVLPSGIAVDGLVVDGTGAPVAGAEIWLEGEGVGSRAGRIVARSNRAGRFALAALDPRQALGAFAPGFAPAFLEQLGTKDASTGAVPITLVLHRAGFELRGRVVDPAGLPVADAHVALGTRGNVVGPGRRAGSSGWRPRARVLVTDGDGRFEAQWAVLDRLAPSVPLHVQASGFALARAEVGAAPSATHDVRLEPGATIEGVVRDADGAAVPDAFVQVVRAGAVEFSDSPFSPPFARASSDGSYRLHHVPAGEVELSAGVEGDPRVGCTAVRAVADGCCERWDLVLGVSRAITGRVVNAAGAGLAGRGVLVRAGNSMSGVTSDGQGRFTYVPDDESEECAFELIGDAGILDRVEGVRAGATIELVALEQAGVVTGGFTDRAARALAGERPLAALTSEDADHFTVQAWLGELGEFEFTGVAPGRYRVRIHSGELVLAESPPFDLAEGEVVELEWLESNAAPR
jgi:RNA polymerase sigma-70 factor (ECF subfamily)